jgi:AcrR family transcriptional regulator
METRQRGRPRSFDRDAALDKAVRLFWSKGYEATSISDLTAALGIGAPSLYAAFGDKRALFDEVIEAYGLRYGGYIARALAEEPTAKQAIARILHEAADEHTRTGRPRGCMLLCAADNTNNVDVAEQLRQIRNGDLAVFEQRIRADIEVGILPTDTDAASLARYTCAVLQGMSQSARDGASREELERVAALAIQGWPSDAPIVKLGQTRFDRHQRQRFGLRKMSDHGEKGEEAPALEPGFAVGDAFE